MEPLVAGKLPEGWTEETQPEGVAVEEWLQCKSASSRFALEEESGTPTWGVLTVNGERRSCAPYLSSLRGGETGMGTVRSPASSLQRRATLSSRWGPTPPRAMAG